ncbi:hypothetical protein [Trichormus sp. NMC-1]|uniref:hypothetical protein n=1 Tax=Trichormus sp. NMC-1 TaxID=1853259 RepID=UPI00115FC1DA|nr:hypothetical protein [Trichormus sp. NMC-1]
MKIRLKHKQTLGYGRFSGNNPEKSGIGFTYWDINLFLGWVMGEMCLPMNDIIPYRTRLVSSSI